MKGFAFFAVLLLVGTAFAAEQEPTKEDQSKQLQEWLEANLKLKSSEGTYASIVSKSDGLLLAFHSFQEAQKAHAEALKANNNDENAEDVKALQEKLTDAQLGFYALLGYFRGTRASVAGEQIDQQIENLEKSGHKLAEETFTEEEELYLHRKYTLPAAHMMDYAYNYLYMPSRFMMRQASYLKYMREMEESQIIRKRNDKAQNERRDFEDLKAHWDWEGSEGWFAGFMAAWEQTHRALAVAIKDDKDFEAAVKAKGPKAPLNEQELLQVDDGKLGDRKVEKITDSESRQTNSMVNIAGVGLTGDNQVLVGGKAQK